MKKIFTLLVILQTFLNANSQNTYYWVGGAGSTTAAEWANGNNWNTTLGGGGTSRSTPNAGDILIFDLSDNSSTAGAQSGSVTVTNIPTQTISELRIIQSSTTGLKTVTFSGAATTLTLSGNLTINNECRLADGGYTISVGGNFLSNANSSQTLHTSSGSGKILFTGTSPSFTIQATATAVRNGSAVSEVIINSGGSGYLAAPTVTFTGGGGSGAVATATLTNGVVTSVNVTNGGTGYNSTPTVWFNSGGNLGLGNVEISSNTTLTQNGILQINGNLHINSGGKLVQNGRSIILNATNGVGGTISGSGTINGLGGVTGTLVVQGTGGSQTQNIGTINFDPTSATTSTINSLTYNRTNSTITIGTTHTNGLSIAGSIVLNAGTLNDGGNVINVAGGHMIATSNTADGGAVHTGTGRIKFTRANNSAAPAFFYATAANARITVGNFSWEPSSTNTLNPVFNLLVNPTSGNPPITNSITVTQTGEFNFVNNGSTLRTITVNSDGTPANAGPNVGSTVQTSKSTVTYILSPTATLNIPANLTFDFNGRPVTFQSSSAGTARLGQINGTLNGATNVTVERFIGIPTAKRAWRMLTAPLRSTASDVSIFNTWQEGGAQITGYGTLVTGANANAATNGLDVTSGTSLRSFVNGAWVDVTNTKTTPLFTTAANAANRSFAVFVRGDRSSLTSTSGQSTTVLRATGALQTGNQTFDINGTADGFTFLGNPYASPVDYNKLYASNSSKLHNYFYIWDPTIADAGAYVTITKQGNGSTRSNPASAANHHIPSGMAFFVRTVATLTSPNNTLTFSESHKSDTTVNNVFRSGAQLESFNVSLLLLNTTSGNWGNVDGLVARYNNGYSTDVFTTEDITKMLNPSENISLKRNGSLLSIESRPLIDNDDTLFVSMSNIKQNRSYKFAFDPQNFDAPGLTAYLEDAFLNNATPVSLSAPTEIIFTTTATAGSFAADRFRIVFKQSSTLSTSGLTVKASLVEKQVRIDWSMVNENNVKGYTVERSSDGKTFTALTAVNAKANDNSTVSYDAMDASPLNGMNYYRIKATDVNGKITYSAIVRIKTNDTKASVTVYPNPVKGEQLNIQLNGLSKGTYTMRLYNNLGQEVYGSTLQVTQTAMSQTLNIAALKTSGVYTLRITNGDQTIEQTIVAQ